MPPAGKIMDVLLASFAIATVSMGRGACVGVGDGTAMLVISPFTVAIISSDVQKDVATRGGGDKDIGASKGLADREKMGVEVHSLAAGFAHESTFASHNALAVTPVTMEEPVLAPVRGTPVMAM